MVIALAALILKLGWIISPSLECFTVKMSLVKQKPVIPANWYLCESKVFQMSSKARPLDLA